MTLSETTSGKLISLFIGLSLYLAEGINYAELAPFFPTEAHNRKDVSITMIGLITGRKSLLETFSVLLFEFLGSSL